MAKSFLEKLGVMVDCSRNSVMKPDALKKLIDILAKLGYNTIKLYTEDTYEIEGEPYFGYMRGRYTKEELKEIDAYAAAKGMELIPCVQTLAHLEMIFRWPEYSAMRDIGPILLVGEEKTYAFIEKIFKTLAETFTSRTVNIGMDEAHDLGRGVYLDRNGEKPRSEIMRKHLERVLAIAEKYGFTCEMWSDMFLRCAYGDYYEKFFDKAEEVIPNVPKNVRLIYWDYYHIKYEQYDELIKRHLKFSSNVQFAGGAWTWLGFCPCNRYSIQKSLAALAACRDNGIKEVCMTMWGDNGGECSPFMVLPTLVTVAECAKGNFDEEKIKQRFKSVVGMDYDAFMALELPNLDEDVSKYMLYNDPFIGLMDDKVIEGGADRMKKAADILSSYGKNKRWGYIFKSIAALANVLAIKYDLGVRTRKAYNSGDKAAVRAIAEDYKVLDKRLEEFYAAFMKYWYTEKKAFGSEVSDVRLGGLIKRVKHCRKQLLDYANGSTERIEELEEKQLQVEKTNTYAWMVTTNIL